MNFVEVRWDSNKKEKGIPQSFVMPWQHFKAKLWTVIELRRKLPSRQAKCHSHNRQQRLNLWKISSQQRQSTCHFTASS